ncbi:hypothetical protein NMY22_g17179 [Coprinellus aureogranulatus]|nr:hypothetical protein NMY22_g17179 [Coprinellus aureogranulatus]
MPVNTRRSATKSGEGSDNRGTKKGEGTKGSGKISAGKRRAKRSSGGKQGATSGNSRAPKRLAQTYTFPEGSRDSRFPTIYLVEDHPLHPPANPGRTFVVYVRPTLAAMEEQEQFQRGLEIPTGQKEELDAKGWLEMKSGDYLFKRNELGTHDPKDDVLCAWNVDGMLQMAKDKEALLAAVRKALGDRETRTPTQVHIEKRFQPIKPDVRCITIPQSIERATVVASPCASLKNSDNPEEAQEMAHDLTEAVMSMAMKSMSFAPMEVQAPLRERAEALGLPRIGVPDNWAYQTLQCNISAVCTQEGGKIGQIGTFGEAHFDEHDSAGHYTSLIPCSDLPSEDYDAGYFFLLSIGVYVCLNNFSSFNFQGLEKHGGSGPFPPPGVTPPAYAYRFMNVAYPPHALMDPHATRYRLSLLPGGPLYIAPEMRQITFQPPSLAGTESATYCRQGHAIMDPVSQSTFVMRSLYDVCRYSVNQVHASVGLAIDEMAFAKSFRLRNTAGDLVEIPGIEKLQLPPTGVGNSASSLSELSKYREHSETMWQKHYNRTAGLIPLKFMRSEALRKAVNPLIALEEETASSGNTQEGSSSGSKRKAPDSIGIAGGPAKKSKKSASGAKDKVRVGDGKQRESGEDVEQEQEEQGYGNNPTELAKEAHGKDGEGKAKRKKKLIANEGSPLKFAFTRASTAYALELEVLQVARERRTMEQQVTADSSRPSPSQVIESMTERDVVHHPEHYTTTDDIGTLATGVKTLQHLLDEEARVCRDTRRIVVAAKYRTLEWVEKDVPDRAMELMGGNAMEVDDDPMAWLPSLVEDLKHMHRKRGVKKQSFSSSHYHFGGGAGDVVVEYTNRKPGRLLAGRELTDEVCLATRTVVRGWLGMTGLDQKLYWFMTILREKLGEEALTMDYTWQILSHFRATYVVSGRADRAQVEDASAFEKELQEHPITKEMTKENALYERYKGLLTGKLSPEDIAGPVLAGEMWAKYTHMWRMGMLYVRDPCANVNDKFYRAVQEDSDYFLPARESASSRQRVTGNDGPYAPSLFGPIRPNAQRSIENAKRYWETIEERDWTAFTSSPERPTFSKTFRWFRPTKQKRTLFSNLGNLGGMCLVGDMAIAQVCEMPTVSEMASVIVEIGSGAVRGLIRLGLLPALEEFLDHEKSAKEAMVREGLEEVMRFVEATFTEDERKEMGWNIIVCEHSLCKLARALKHNKL